MRATHRPGAATQRLRSQVWDDDAMADRLRRALGPLVVLAALTLTACGATSTPSSQAPSPAAATGARAAKARFIAQAQSVCRTLSAQEQPLKARQESLKRLPSAVADKEFVALVRQLAALSRAADGKLRTLARPAGDAQNIERLLTSFSQQLTDVADVANAAAKQESSVGEAAVMALRRSIAQSISHADRYGMKACVSAE
ncbi:MAG: hypothetical protein JWN10_2590 [Solirubrobacterales bacterium]|nr:hypothetical protein [Solirubrobacterales bacterium]